MSFVSHSTSRRRSSTVSLNQIPAYANKSPTSGTFNPYEYSSSSGLITSVPSNPPSPPPRVGRWARPGSKNPLQPNYNGAGATEVAPVPIPRPSARPGQFRSSFDQYSSPAARAIAAARSPSSVPLDFDEDLQFQMDDINYKSRSRRSSLGDSATASTRYVTSFDSTDQSTSRRPSDSSSINSTDSLLQRTPSNTSSASSVSPFSPPQSSYDPFRSSVPSKTPLKSAHSPRQASEDTLDSPAFNPFQPDIRPRTPSLRPVAQRVHVDPNMAPLNVPVLPDILKSLPLPSLNDSPPRRSTGFVVASSTPYFAHLASSFDHESLRDQPLRSSFASRSSTISSRMPTVDRELLRQAKTQKRRASFTIGSPDSDSSSTYSVTPRASSRNSSTPRY